MTDLLRTRLREDANHLQATGSHAHREIAKRLHELLDRQEGAPRKMPYDHAHSLGVRKGDVVVVLVDPNERPLGAREIDGKRLEGEGIGVLYLLDDGTGVVRIHSGQTDRLRKALDSSPIFHGDQSREARVRRAAIEFAVAQGMTRGSGGSLHCKPTIAMAEYGALVDALEESSR